MSLAWASRVTRICDRKSVVSRLHLASRRLAHVAGPPRSTCGGQRTSHQERRRRPIC